jgi:hypothetical protein
MGRPAGDRSAGARGLPLENLADIEAAVSRDAGLSGEKSRIFSSDWCCCGWNLRRPSRLGGTGSGGARGAMRRSPPPMRL